MIDMKGFRQDVPTRGATKRLIPGDLKPFPSGNVSSFIHFYGSSLMTGIPTSITHGAHHQHQVKQLGHFTSRQPTNHQLPPLTPARPFLPEPGRKKKYDCTIIDPIYRTMHRTSALRMSALIDICRIKNFQRDTSDVSPSKLEFCSHPILPVIWLSPKSFGRVGRWHG
jgi:hypothetical protein